MFCDFTESLALGISVQYIPWLLLLQNCTLQWVPPSNSHRFGFFAHRLSCTCRFKLLHSSTPPGKPEGDCQKWYWKTRATKNIFIWKVFQLRDESFFSKEKRNPKRPIHPVAIYPGGSAVSWEEEQEPELRLPLSSRAPWSLPRQCSSLQSRAASLLSLSDSNPVLNPSIVRAFLISWSFIGKHLHFQCNCN